MKRPGVLKFALCGLAVAIAAAAAAPPWLWAQQAGHEEGQPPSGASSPAPASSTRANPQPAAGEGSANAPAEHENRAKVSLADFAWLEGKWQGNWGPRIAEQVWMGARGGEMPGLFRVAENDKTLVLELYSLLSTPDGIELRLRHLTPALVPWESSTTVLRLARLDANQAVFENTSEGQPSRSMLIRVDGNTYISRTEISADSSNKQVTEIRFHRVIPAPEQASPASPQKKKKKQ